MIMGEPTKIVGSTTLDGNTQMYTQVIDQKVTPETLLFARVRSLERVVAEMRDELQDLRETVDDGEVWIGGTESEVDDL